MTFNFGEVVLNNRTNTMLNDWVANQSKSKVQEDKKKRLRRDRLIHQIITATTTRTKKDGIRYISAKPGKKKLVMSLQDKVNKLNAEIRPHYPAPKYARTEDYPDGGLWAAPKSGATFETMKAEFLRVKKYRETLFSKNQNDPRVERIRKHLEFMVEKLRVQSLIEKYRAQSNSQPIRTIVEYR